MLLACYTKFNHHSKAKTNSKQFIHNLKKKSYECPNFLGGSLYYVEEDLYKDNIAKIHIIRTYSKLFLKESNLLPKRIFFFKSIH